jgi:hypothetical protein
MTAKCANPSCPASFHRLRGGRLFRFEVQLPSSSCRDVPETVRSMKSGVASVYFWLCEKCALTKTLSFDAARGLSIEPIEEICCLAESTQNRLAATMDQAA